MASTKTIHSESKKRSPLLALPPFHKPLISNENRSKCSTSLYTLNFHLRRWLREHASSIASHLLLLTSRALFAKLQCLRSPLSASRSHFSLRVLTDHHRSSSGCSTDNGNSKTTPIFNITRTLIGLHPHSEQQTWVLPSRNCLIGCGGRRR